MVVLLAFSVWFAACAQGEEPVVEEEIVPAEPVEEKPLPGDMVLIPAGEFTLGSDEKAGNPPIASPAHTVDLPAHRGARPLLPACDDKRQVSIHRLLVQGALAAGQRSRSGSRDRRAQNSPAANTGSSAIEAYNASIGERALDRL